MSRHASFGKSGRGGQKRSVLKRFERVDIMKKAGTWDPKVDKRVTGLPKTRIQK